MKLIYKEIADRSLSSAQALLNSGYREKAGFLSYHAFESLGGALVEHHNVSYSMSHNKKINQFIAAAGQHGNFQHSVRQVSIILESLSRNNFLYPNEILPGQFTAPKDRLVDAEAQDLIRRVTGIKARIDQIV